MRSGFVGLEVGGAVEEEGAEEVVVEAREEVRERRAEEFRLLGER